MTDPLRDDFDAVLADIRRDRATARYHPLGFTKVTLLRLFGFRARLHVWHGPHSEHPHDHRWGFVGVPLWGCFVDIRWRLEPGNTHRAVTTAPPRHGTGRLYRRTRITARLALADVHDRWPFVPYRCRRGEIHSYAPSGSGWHVSLLLHGPAYTDTSTVWQPRENP